MFVEGKPRTVFFLQTLYLRYLSRRLKKSNMRAGRTWSWVSSGWENIKRNVEPWMCQTCCRTLLYSVTWLFLNYYRVLERKNRWLSVIILVLWWSCIIIYNLQCHDTILQDITYRCPQPWFGNLVNLNFCSVSAKSTENTRECDNISSLMI